MKITFDFPGQKIGVEGDGPELLAILQAAREIAPSLPAINIQMVPGHAPAITPPDLHRPITPPNTTPNQNGTAPTAPMSGQTIKQFVRALPLSNASERIAAVAYYVKHHEGKDIFSPKDVEGWFAICAIPKPSQMPVAFFDAKRHHGYVEGAGHGKWKLTTNGENLIIGKLNRAEEGAA